LPKHFLEEVIVTLTTLKQEGDSMVNRLISWIASLFSVCLALLFWVTGSPLEEETADE
jgi:hypothetical protein